jgi:hypothetical protein
MMIHNHHENIHNSCPSEGDIVSRYAMKKSLISTPDGLVEFGLPSEYPANPKNIQIEETRDMKSEEIVKNPTFLKLVRDKIFVEVLYNELTKEQLKDPKTQLSEQFVIDHNLVDKGYAALAEYFGVQIVRHDWDEPEKIEALLEFAQSAISTPGQ